MYVWGMHGYWWVFWIFLWILFFSFTWIMHTIGVPSADPTRLMRLLVQ
jgi:hypothetical protein